MSRGRLRDVSEKVEPGIIAGMPPPHDLDAEAACLSAMLLKADAIPQVRRELEPVDFYSIANTRICEAVFDLDAQRIGVDLVTVANWLRERDILEQHGGPGYLAQIVDATPAVANVANHARIVRQRAVQRRKIAAMQVATARLYRAPEDEVVEALADVQRSLDEPSHRAVQRTRASIGESLRVAVDGLTSAASKGGELPVGVPMGIASFDRIAGGLHESETVFLSGPTGNGKTSFASQIALNVARHGEWHPTKVDAEGKPVWVPFGVAIFTLEMTREDYALRMASSWGRVDVQSLRNGTATLEDWSRLRGAQIEIDNLAIEIDDEVRQTPREIESRLVTIRREMEARGVRLRAVIIDQIQLMRPSDTPSKQSTDEQVFFNIGQDLRAISLSPPGKRETLIVLSQENAKGQLARCSALKQHAVTWISVKVDKAETDSAWKSGRHAGEATIKKQRFGPSPETLPLWFEGPFTRFSDGAL